jgi:hypothetical protein
VCVCVCARACARVLWWKCNSWLVSVLPHECGAEPEGWTVLILSLVPTLSIFTPVYITMTWLHKINLNISFWSLFWSSKFPPSERSPYPKYICIFFPPIWSLSAHCNFLNFITLTTA